MANLRAAQKEMTRRLLLSTALELFESQGYAATTVDEIASTAGTTRVTFYAYFPSRAALLRALIEQLNELLERSNSPLSGSTAEELVAVVRKGGRDDITAWLVRTADRWPVIRPYVLAATEAAVVDKELRELVDQWYEEVIGDIEAGLNQADRFDATERHTRGMMAFTLLDQTARRWMQHGWEAESEQVIALLADTWLHLLGDLDENGTPRAGGADGTAGR